MRITIVIIALVVLGSALYLFLLQNQEGNTQTLLNIPLFSTSTTEGSPPLTEPIRTRPEGWLEYRNERYSFSLFYPQGMKVKVFDEGGGAATITFEDEGNARGFQIFATPYAETQISEERFLRDTPSGVRNEPINLTVDGAPATAFYSTHAFLGDTREVWFLHKGYLFEVTTLKGLDEWFFSILQTWRFI